jgi:copper chaperone CopZ
MISTIVIVVLIGAFLLVGARHYRRVMRAGCCGDDADPRVKKLRVTDRNVRHYPYQKEIDVEGMTCGNCVAKVQNALNTLDGVYAKVDLSQKRATVRMRTELPDQLLRSAVADCGYAVKSIRVNGQTESRAAVAA